MTGNQNPLTKPHLLAAVREAMQRQASHRIDTTLPDFLQDKLDALDTVFAERRNDKPPHRHH